MNFTVEKPMVDEGSLYIKNLYIIYTIGEIFEVIKKGESDKYCIKMLDKKIVLSKNSLVKHKKSMSKKFEI